MQQLSKAGAAFVRTLEGVVLKAYYDNATPPTLTIGIGSTWASAAFRSWWGKNRKGQAFDKSATLARDEADDILSLMFNEEYGAAVAKFLGKEVPQNVFDGTASPVFNLGTGSLKWRWAAAVKAGDYKAAADLIRVTGTTAGGKVLKGLVTRRKEEAELISTGDYAIGGKTPAVAEPDAMADGVLRRRERGDDVKEIQGQLRTLGFYDQSLDGIFGYGTEAAVLAFQRQSSVLADDGVAGPQTLAAIKAALSPDAAPVEHPAPIAPTPVVSVQPSPAPALPTGPININPAPLVLINGSRPPLSVDEYRQIAMTAVDCLATLAKGA